MIFVDCIADHLGMRVLGDLTPNAGTFPSSSMSRGPQLGIGRSLDRRSDARQRRDAAGEQPAIHLRRAAGRGRRGGQIPDLSFDCGFGRG
jgi:hypothetical protein